MVNVTPEDRSQGDSNTPQKHVWRAKMAGVAAGVFRSVQDLKVAIDRFVVETNADPKPLVWITDPRRVRERLAS